ncbi:MAG: NAD(P)/FAD-dependent oxidoreductase [Mojavia pulchra JT2-VF2]|jgi:flavin-dependent dehydrogenase|uniref:NAD(P)/FAD-dependent oxidoreductase n=1 Tax=Mojavia pulchra JT2-VF2 TaxID=287848 RepID=A0A951UGH2_9NOST|nr:NAD(P)/FAD-dependent oxidoreductase [Mojavia pulchra JT2-VF2]
MKSFDVVVVGAGPAGGHCARLLAKAGRKVLLVERYENFSVNSFSSAGTPIETLAKFDLPNEVIGSFWKGIKIVTTNLNETWKSSKLLGVVLDFSKLKEYLANQVIAHGGEVWMGCFYLKKVEEDQTIIVLKSKKEGEIRVTAKVLVDATGPSRAVMYNKKEEQPFFYSGTGIEYLIEVEEEDYEKQCDQLTFFLGHKWMPKGYSWVFPMEKFKLKVGAGSLNSQHELIPNPEPIKYYIELIIKEYIKPKSYKILEIHGGTLKYSKGLKDNYYKNNIIAIGDAVSTVNFLGGEGIRHGMHSAEIAFKYINQYLDGELVDFKNYQQEMYKVFYKKWIISEKLGMKKYLLDSDSLVDRSITYLKFLNIDEIVDLLFNYKFESFSKIFLIRLAVKSLSFLRKSLSLSFFSSKY